MDKRIFDLRRQLERARDRVRYCRAELERFGRADRGESRMAAALARLAEDLREAEQDAAWAEIALADATAPTEVVPVAC